MENNVRYNAFISYKHAPTDMEIAKRIHKGLETFKVPGSVRKKTGKQRIERIFRDQEELPIGSDLGNNITAALSASEFLIVICSPQTPKSYWVQKEIETFISMHGREHILAVLVEGEPDESFPALLLSDDAGNPVEPLAADVRGTTDKERFDKLKTELLRLAAPLLGCTYDELRQRHRERRVKKIISAAIAVAIFGVAFGAYSFYNAALIAQNLKEKQINQSKYLANKSLELLEYGDRRAAALVAMEALPSADEDRPYVPLAQLALSNALGSYDIGSNVSKDGILRHDLTVSDMCFNQAGDKLISTTGAGSVYVWDIVHNVSLFEILPMENDGYMCTPICACFNEADEAVVVNKLGVFVYGEDGELVREVMFHEDAYVTAALCHEDSNLLAVQSLDALYMYDMDAFEQVAQVAKPGERSFSQEIAFSDDGDMIAVSHSNPDDTSGGMVSVYDLISGSLATYECSGDFVMETTFANGGGVLAIASGDTTGGALYGKEEYMKGYLEVYSLATKELLWEETYDVSLYGTDSSTLHLMSRNYEKNGNHEELILAVNDVIATYNTTSGELIAETYMNSGVVELRISIVDVYGYVGCGDENIYVVDLTTGNNYTGSMIETGREVAGFAIRSGNVVVRSYLSPDVLVMKYHEGEGIEVVAEFEESVMGIQANENNSRYVVEEYAGLSASVFHFYNGRNSEKIGVYEADIDRSVGVNFWTQDEEFLIGYREGLIVYLDKDGTEKKQVMLNEEEFSTGDYYVTNNGEYLLFTDIGQYVVFDVLRGKVIASGEISQYINGLLLSEDGKYMYGLINEFGVVQVDASTAQITPLSIEGVEVFAGSDCVEKFAIDQDGERLAVACKDNRLRVIDLSSLEVMTEIPFATGYRSFITFTEDGEHLIMQGDDYYINVYGLLEDAFVYIPMTQNNQIAEYAYDAASDIHMLLTSGELLLLTGEDYIPVFEQQNAKCYLMEEQAVLSSKYQVLYKHPYKDLEMLYEEARTQFGDATLSVAERIRYNVD